MITTLNLDRNTIFALTNPMTPTRIKRMRRRRLFKRVFIALFVAAISACAMIG